MARSLVAAVLICALGGCATAPASRTLGATVSVEPGEAAPAGWRETALPEDVARLATLDKRWIAALAAARPRFAKALEREGGLLAPEAALDRPEPSPGRYRCRVARIGRDAAAPRAPAFAIAKPNYCFVAAESKALALTKGTGAHRPGGWLWADGDRRMVFLGGTATRASGPVPVYGAAAKTNAVGILERIGDFRWRLVLPVGVDGSRIDVIELVPDTPAPIEPAR